MEPARQISVWRLSVSTHEVGDSLDRLPTCVDDASFGEEGVYLAFVVDVLNLHTGLAERGCVVAPLIS